MSDTIPPISRFVPSAQDEASVQAWFAEYDDLAARRDFEAMADMAMFPLNEVTDDGAVTGSARQRTREEFIGEMREVMGEPDASVTMESTRTPYFLSECLVFVITDARLTVGERVQPLRYGDLLVKAGERWRFQTMVQGGWADAS